MIYAILIGLCLLVLIKNNIYRRDLRKLLSQIEEIEDYGLKNTRLDGLSLKPTRELGEKYNQLFKKNQDLELDYKNREENIKNIVASISHDLRTPLTSIKGYTDVLYEDLKDPEDLKYLDIIRSRIKALEELIESFYQLSKLEVEDFQEKLEYVDLREIILEVLAEHYDRFVERGLEPKIKIDQDDFKIIGDRLAIERVITNLIDNAIKYSSREIEILLTRQEGRIVNSFKNDIENLEEDDIARIFDKFFVMDTSRQGDSTGLGLFITSKLVDNMGYRIDVAKEDGYISFNIDWN